MSGLTKLPGTPVIVQPKDAASPPREDLAGPGRRLAAWGLDAAIGGIVFLPLNPALYDRSPSPPLAAALLVVTVICGVVYMSAFDAGSRGATPGKRLLRIRVRSSDGTTVLGFRRALLRRIVYVAGGLCFYVGWLWLLFDRRRRTWHDIVADTVVVRTPG